MHAAQASGGEGRTRTRGSGLARPAAIHGRRQADRTKEESQEAVGAREMIAAGMEWNGCCARPVARWLDVEDSRAYWITNDRTNDDADGRTDGRSSEGDVQQKWRCHPRLNFKLSHKGPYLNDVRKFFVFLNLKSLSHSRNLSVLSSAFGVYFLPHPLQTSLKYSTQVV